MVDSATFTATIVPEFPLAALPFAAGMVTAIAMAAALAVRTRAAGSRPGMAG